MLLFKSYTLREKIILLFFYLPIHPIKIGVNQILWKFTRNYERQKNGRILGIWQLQIQNIFEFSSHDVL